jgi:DNA-binding LytR/AlgR family response regulator
LAVLLRMLLVDDEPLALRLLVASLRDEPDVEIVGTANDGDAALHEARRLKPDLVVLDVEMPGRDGMSVAAELEREGGMEIIFLSAFDRYATAAFDVEALDYLLKPLKPERLRQALARARRRRVEREAYRAASDQGADRPTVHVPDRDGGHDVALADIVWIEAARDYALIHTRMRTHILRVTMTDLATRMSGSIVRVHRSAFVNLSEVRSWTTPTTGGGRYLVLSDSTEVPVGPSYVAEIRLALRSLGA